MPQNRAVIVGIRLLSAFFIFGVSMCLLTIALLMYPNSFLAPLWRLNPEAQRSLQRIGGWAIVLMTVVALACLLSAIGLIARAEWGRRLAIAVLAANLLGDTIAAVVRQDLRTLIGLPIGGAVILFLLNKRVQREFPTA